MCNHKRYQCLILCANGLFVRITALLAVDVQGKLSRVTFTAHYQQDNRQASSLRSKKLFKTDAN